jgi:YNFM family putative membrane transporter
MLGMTQSGRQIARGSPAFRRVNRAMFAAGFATFALVYCVQPLMPEFARTFGVSAATSSLSLSVTTAVLAVALLVVGALSDAWGRRAIMTLSLLASALLTLVTAIVPSWHALLLLRGLEGLTFAGVPALALAYLSEEVQPESVGLAIGLYIGGSALGGMSGRLLTGTLTDLFSWRAAVSAIGAIGVVAAVVFARSLPPSVHFTPRRVPIHSLLDAYALHLRDRHLVALFGEAFLLMGGFVAAYNYLGFRLGAPPYALSHSVLGAVFLVYLVGIGSSAWIGHLAGTLGRGPTFRGSVALMLGGVLLTLAPPLWLVVSGLIVMTFGFFGAHSVASSWVGLRARQSRAHASSLYLFAYYTGASVAGWAGGIFWNHWHWAGVAGFVGVLLAGGLLASLAFTDR